MDSASNTQDKQSASAVSRALEFGIDVTLLQENLSYAPTERLRRAESAIRAAEDFREEALRARDRAKR